ncbi:uncharacterized protein LOC117644965 isoform X2 [Thrips palmi]|uniref:Uncharacterized protein LOC117644965 isoform X2 n=1 Tax=Thrips palmi TaxID=161013 RepID=A0A6P8Z290_THRPL|nr:uncharacterized protein LOC117644965 isoform X2 [Thrips palmi]
MKKARIPTMHQCRKGCQAQPGLSLRTLRRGNTARPEATWWLANLPPYREHCSRAQQPPPARHGSARFVHHTKMPGAHAYERLVKAFCKRYTGEWTKQKIQDEYNATWREMKANFKGAEQLNNAVTEKVKELEEAITAKRAKLLTLLAKGAKRQRLDGAQDPLVAEAGDAEASFVGADDSHDDKPVEIGAQLGDACPVILNDDSDGAGDSPVSSTRAPRQEALKSEISLLQSKLDGLVRRRDELADPEVEGEIRETRLLIDKKQKELKHKQACAMHAREFRKRQRALLMELRKMNADASSTPVDLSIGSG